MGPQLRPSVPRHGAAGGEELRNLRRWVIVAGVWAVAATAIALIALLDSSGSEAQKEAGDAAGRVAATERKLDRRIDALETRLDGLPSSDDITNLQDRLSRAEQDVARAATAAKDARMRAGELEDRTEQLEQDPPASTGAEPGAAEGADRP